MYPISLLSLNASLPSFLLFSPLFPPFPSPTYPPFHTAFSHLLTSFAFFFSLQFRGEVDPGSEDFWNHLTPMKFHKDQKEQKFAALEIGEERVIYTKEQANSILEKLFKAGMFICVSVWERETERMCVFVYAFSSLDWVCL